MMLGASLYVLGLVSGEDVLQSTHCMWYFLDSKIESFVLAESPVPNF